MSDHPQSPVSPKEPYEAPLLKRLGTITELTRGNYTPTLDDFTLAGSAGE